MKNIVTLLMISVTIWSCTHLKSETRKDSKRPIEIVVHRGAHREAPENTFAAMRKAVDQGAAYIEIDLSVSSDGVLYCLHDKTLDRTTNGDGEIAHRSSTYIDTLDAGSWFSPAFRNERVPRVTDLIREFRGKIKFYFDVKEADIDQLISMIRTEKLENDCFVWFSDNEKAKVLMDKAPDIPVKMNAGSPAEIRKLLTTCRPQVIESDAAHITVEMLATCRKNNLKLMASLLRDSWWEYKRMIEMEVDMVNLDHPDYFTAMLTDPENKFNHYRLAAHRGGIVENTFSEFDPRSIKAAIDSGYWMLEIDVRPTADRHVVVHHDATLSRVYGIDRKVEDMTLAELKALKSISGGYAPMTFEELSEMCAGKIRFMMDIKPANPEPWFTTEVNRILEKYDMLENAYFIRNDVQSFFDKGKFGFRMNEAEEMRNRLKAGENIAARYYLFDHGNRLNAEVARWCQRNSIDVCASVNVGHYRMEDHMAGAARDIAHLKDCGVTLYQIDSDYDRHFKLKKAESSPENTLVKK